MPNHQRTYMSFQEFEREELHRLDTDTVDAMIETSFAEDIDFSMAEARWFASADDEI